MKKFFILLVFISSSINLFAQFKLSGKIAHYTGHDGLTLNIPKVFEYNVLNSVKIHVKKDGSFSITLPVKRQKFANLIFQQSFHLVLLDAGKNLKVLLSEGSAGFKPAAGSALPENLVLQATNLDEDPSFLKDFQPYYNMSQEALNAKLIKPYFGIRDNKIAQINQSAINLKDKQLIISELNSTVYNNLYRLTLLGPYTEKLDNVIVAAFDKADPKPETPNPGPQYYIFADHYLWYKEYKASILYTQTQRLKTNEIVPGYGMTQPALMALSKKYGNIYMSWLGAIRFLPAPVVEQLGYLYILNVVNVRFTQLATILVSEYDKKFPKGMYRAELDRKVASLTK